MNQTVRKNDPSRMPVMKTGFRASAKDAWLQYAPIYDFAPVEQGKNESLFVNKSWFTEGLLFGEQTLDANIINRTRQHFQDSDHLVVFHRYLSGYSHGLNDDKPFSTVPGMISVRDYSKPFRGYQSPCVAQGIYVPRDWVAFRPKADGSSYSFAERTPAGRVINAEFDHFFDLLKRGTKALDAARLERLIACFTVALNGVETKQDVRALARDAMSDVIREFIEDNLSFPRLSTSFLLSEFGVSRATLYRIFERDGGVRNYISTRRLIRSAIDLASTPTRRGEISRTAERWGFSSSASFNRAVKNYFGTAPGSLFEHPIMDNQKRLKGMPRDEAFSSSALWKYGHALSPAA